MGRIRTTQWNLFFNYAAFALVVVQGIILVPLYLQHIPLTQYGAWIASGNVLAWLTILDPGVSTVLMQRISYSYGARQFEDIVPFGIAGVLVSILIACALFIIGLSVAATIPEWLQLADGNDSMALQSAFAVAVAGTGLLILSFSVVAINQGLQSSIGIGLIYVAANVAAILVTIGMLLLGYGLLALAMAIVTRGGGMLLGNVLYLMWRLRRLKVSPHLSFKKVRELCRLSSYSFLGRLSSTLAQNCEAFVVSRFIGVEQAAVLSLTRRAPDSSRMLVERPAVSFMPAVAHMLGEGDVDKARRIILRLIRLQLWIGGLLVSGFLSLNDDFVRLWVGQHLFAGKAINFAVCIAFVFGVWTASLSNLAFALGNVKGNSLVAAVEGAMAVMLVVVGTYWFGMYGAVIGPILASVALGSWYYPKALASRLKAQPGDRRSLFHEGLITLGSVAFTGLLFDQTKVSNWWSFIFAALLASICYFLVLMIASRQFREEAQRARHWITRRFDRR